MTETKSNNGLKVIAWGGGVVWLLGVILLGVINLHCKFISMINKRTLHTYKRKELVVRLDQLKSEIRQSYLGK